MDMVIEDGRKQRGILLAKSSKRIKNLKGSMYIVPSQTHGGSYVVDKQARTCTCPDYAETLKPCKHMFALEVVLTRGVAADGTEITSAKITYAQNWSQYNVAQTTEKAKVEVLLKSLCEAIEQPKQGRGRPALLLRDVAYGNVMKAYTTWSGRRATTDIRRAAEAGHMEAAPHYNSLFRYMESPTLTPVLTSLLEHSAMPLSAIEQDFAIDSTGFTRCTFTRWFDERGLAKREHEWVKAHVVIGVRSHIVTAAEITDADQNDSPVMPCLVRRTAKHFTIRNFTADKQYPSMKNYLAVEKAGGTPYLMFKSNAVGHHAPPIWKKMFHLFCANHEAYLDTYHERSNVEATFSAAKRKLGPVRSKLPKAMENEVLAKLVAYNLTVIVHMIAKFGIDPMFWPEKVA